MITESTVEPSKTELRKIGLIDDKPVAYIYLNTDIRQEQRENMDKESETIYVYDSRQVTTPLPKNIEIENLDEITHHSASQRTLKKGLHSKLGDITDNIRVLDKTRLRNVNRRDTLTQVTEAEKQSYTKIVEPVLVKR